MYYERAIATARRHRMAGLTLLELLVVLLVLVAVAGIVIPNVTESRNFAQQTVTEQTLMRVRAAIMGDERVPGLWRDLGGREADLPRTISELFERRVHPPENEWPKFDPNTRLGWRGPYLNTYGTEGAQAVIDGWGRPIVIQFPTVPEPDRSLYVRLISAGENGEIDTPLNDLTVPNPAMPAKANCEDDIVLFLRVPDTRPLP